jgi:hypothetical protein
MISILLAMPSQWSLQYFFLSGTGQVQAAFAHFLGVLAIILLCRFTRRGSVSGPGENDTEIADRIVAQIHARIRAESAEIFDYRGKQASWLGALQATQAPSPQGSEPQNAV